MQNKNGCQIENHTSDTENWNDIVSEKFQNRKLEDERWCDIILLGSFMSLVFQKCIETNEKKMKTCDQKKTLELWICFFKPKLDYYVIEVTNTSNMNIILGMNTW